MWLNLIKCVLLGALVISPLGCEPQPVVVDPDDDTTVIEERDTIIDDDTDTDTEPGAGVDVNVGGDRGVEVGVGRDTADEPNENP